MIFLRFFPLTKVNLQHQFILDRFSLNYHLFLSLIFLIQQFPRFKFIMFIINFRVLKQFFLKIYPYSLFPEFIPRFYLNYYYYLYLQISFFIVPKYLYQQFIKFFVLNYYFINHFFTFLLILIELDSFQYLINYFSYFLLLIMDSN